MKPNLIIVSASRRVSFIEKMQEVFSVCVIENEENTPSSKVADSVVVLKDDKEIEDFLIKSKTPFLVLNDRLAYQLASLNYCLGPSRSVARLCYDKLEFAKYFKENRLLNEYYPFPINGEEAFYKPRFGSASRGKTYSAIYSKQDELDLGKPNCDLVVQKKLCAPEYSADCLFYEGEPVEIVVRTRDRVADGEVVNSTILQADPLKYIKKTIKTIAANMQYCGPASFQFMEDQNGTPKIMEINARFGGGCLLSLTACPTFMNNLLVYYNNILEGSEVFSFIKYNEDYKIHQMKRVYREFYF